MTQTLHLYCSVADVRELTRTVYDETITGQSGTTITTRLPFEQTTTTSSGSVNFVYKADTALTGTSSTSPTTNQYHARRPNVLRLGTAAVSTDMFSVNYNYKVTDSFIQDNIIEAVGNIDGKLGRWYSVPFTIDSNSEYPPDVVRACKYLAAACVLERIYVGEQPNLTQLAATYRTGAEEILTALMNNTRILRTTLGVALTRNDTVLSTTVDEKPIFDMGDEYAQGNSATFNDFDSQ